MAEKKKTFKDDQPEGALKGSFFDYIPDAQQISNFLTRKKVGDKVVKGAETVQKTAEEVKKSIKKLPKGKSFMEQAGKKKPKGKAETRYKKGGKVRGSGIARQGVRAAKMV
jgi:hypothetical protein